jgi:drug/metabolite transporter (DMT)-like permease
MYLLIFIQQIIASFTHIIAKDVTTQLDPAVVLFFRSLLAAVFFTFWVLFRSGWKKIDKKDILTFIILGALNIPINQYLFLVAIKITTAPNIALAYAVSPIFVFIIAHFFLKEKTTIMKFTGILIAVIGTGVLLAEQGFDFSSDVFVGNILGGLASLAWALYTIIGKNISRKYGAVYSTSISMQIGFVMYLIMFLFLPSKIDLSQITIANWFEIGYLGILTSGIGYALWYLVLQKIDASRISVFNNLQPLLTTFLAIIFLHQVLTLHFVLGGILILIGVYVTQKY